MSNLPDWVRPKRLAHHKPTRVLFFIERSQRDRSTGKIYLFDAPRGQKGAEYPLDECEAANHLIHLKSVAILTVCGRPISVEREGSRLLVYDDTHRKAVDTHPKWWIDPQVVASAESIAQAFNGAIAWEVL